MRVLLLVQNLPVPFDRRVWQEATALSRGGYDVTVVSPADPDHPPTRETLDDIRVVRYAGPPEARGALGYVVEYTWALVLMFFHALRERRRGRFDVVHFCNPPDLLFLVALPFRLADRATLVFDQHDLGPELVAAKRLPLQRLFTAIARWCERLTYAVADFVISPNESYRAVAIDRGGIAPDRVAVVRSGPSSSWVVPTPPDPAARRGREHMVAYLGVMGRQEGLDYLLDATSVLVRERGRDLQVCLVGSGPDRARLEQRVAELGLEQHVEFLGRVSDEHLRAVLMAADLCVNPDEVNEMNSKSTMNKILEYMAMGRPIVQFDVVEGRYSASESSAYARPNDSLSLAEEMDSLLLDPTRRERMGQFGKSRYVTELAWERQAEHLLRLYGVMTGQARSER